MAKRHLWILPLMGLILVQMTFSGMALVARESEKQKKSRKAEEDKMLDKSIFIENLDIVGWKVELLKKEKTDLDTIEVRMWNEDKGRFDKLPNLENGKEIYAPPGNETILTPVPAKTEPRPSFNRVIRVKNTEGLSVDFSLYRTGGNPGEDKTPKLKYLNGEDKSKLDGKRLTLSNPEDDDPGLTLLKYNKKN
jgi:hypothetical protein